MFAKSKHLNGYPAMGDFLKWLAKSLAVGGRHHQGRQAVRAALRNVGFAVFAKPKLDEDSDVDSDMLDHIAQRSADGLAALAVASADGQAFRLPLEEISRSGVPVQVLGFREHARWALASDTLEFVDLEDIEGVFREPLPRIGLDSLPEKGAWLQPFRPLSSLLTSRA